MLVEETYEYIAPHRQQPSSRRPPKEYAPAGAHATGSGSLAVAIPLQVSLANQLGDYDGQLHGRKRRNPFKKIGRFVKKLAKPVLHAGAAFMTGGASLGLTAAMFKAKQDRRMADAQNAAAERIAASQNEAQWGAGQFMPAPRFEPPAPRFEPLPHFAPVVDPLRPHQPGVAPGVSPFATVPSLAPSADSVRSYLPSPTTTRYSGGEREDREPAFTPAPSTPPAWAIPAALAAGVALLMFTRGGAK